MTRLSLPIDRGVETICNLDELELQGDATVFSLANTRTVLSERVTCGSRLDTPLCGSCRLGTPGKDALPGDAARMVTCALAAPTLLVACDVRGLSAVSVSEENLSRAV